MKRPAGTALALGILLGPVAVTGCHATSSSSANGTTRPSTTSMAEESSASAAALTDGRHLAHVVKISTTKGTITVDVVQILTGADAEKAAKADGTMVSDDYYIRNENKQLRTLSVAATAKITENVSASDMRTGVTKNVNVSFATFARTAQSSSYFWLTTVGGLVMGIEEMYTP
jgi:hypothetical protein